MPDEGPPAFPLWGLGCALFVAAAIGLEVLGGQYANSEVPSWAETLVPIAWPGPLRVAWWLAVSAAAFGYRAAESRAGIRRHPVTVGLSIAPFAIFAVGVAFEAPWATWH